MKARLTKVSLALLSAVFLLGCQEQGSGPVGPGPEFDRPFSHSCTMPVDGHCHDDDVEDPQPSTVALTGGMDAGPFPVGAPKDTRKTLKVSNHNQAKPTIDMDFGSVGPCVGSLGTNGGTLPTPSEVMALEMELTQEAAAAKLVMNIDKASLGESGDHVLSVGYTGNLGLTSIMLGGWPGPVRVDADGDVFTFTGRVVVWDREGPNDERLISCPGATVVVTLER